MAGAKLEFKNLEYIVMEGGGARGAAYLGAIRALEDLMKKHQADNSLEISIHDIVGRTKPGLLDYYKKDGDNKTPVIKGIAGSSAGAITTFALALGFNSDEIETILKYPFEKFLKDVHVGKFRMIDENGKLAIGHDKKKHGFFNAKELTKESEFKFHFDSDYTVIQDNLAKQGKRKLLFGTIFKVVVDGVISNVQQLGTAVNRFFLNDSPEDAPSFWRGFLRWAVRPNNNLIARIGISRALRIILFRVLIPLRIIKVPIKFDDDNVLAAVFDRGMFSGFAVREFFMDLVILAATKDTQFQRGFLKFIQDKDKSINQIEVDKIKAELLRIKGFKIGKRSESKLNTFPYFKKYSSYLENLTFKEFNRITGVNFGLCVSNFSSGFPIYFGHEWTPDFSVMEAVAASKTIPPAIKPLYNASDVVRSESAGSPLSVQTDKGSLPFVNSDGSFELTDYYFYEHIVKLALVQELANPQSGNSVNISVNNSIDLSSFLPKLADIVLKRDTNKEIVDGIEIIKPKSTKLKTAVKGVTYTIDYALYKFFYNATYKGLLIDGGYRINIPYNFFRKDIDKVLVIKLDEHFPPDLMTDVYNAIKNNLNKVETTEVINDIDLSELDIPKIESGAISEILNNAKTITYKTTKADIIAQTELVFSKYLDLWIERGADDNEKEKRRKIVREGFRNRKGEKAVRRLLRSTLKHQRKKHLIPPWAQPKSILATAFEGYEYGSEKGQVKEISDHNQILPLYDYGIGTYDFKMDKVMPQVLLAQAQAEQATLEFFNKP